MRYAINERKAEIPIYVGVGEIATSKNPDHVLVTSLGSCVAVIILAPVIRSAGIAHIALPSSNVNAEQSRAKPGYYADTAIPRLLAEIQIIQLVGGGYVWKCTAIGYSGCNNQPLR